MFLGEIPENSRKIYNFQWGENGCQTGEKSKKNEHFQYEKLVKFQLLSGKKMI